MRYLVLIILLLTGCSLVNKTKTISVRDSVRISYLSRTLVVPMPRDTVFASIPLVVRNDTVKLDTVTTRSKYITSKQWIEYNVLKSESFLNKTTFEHIEDSLIQVIEKYKNEQSTEYKEVIKEKIPTVAWFGIVFFILTIVVIVMTLAKKITYGY